MAEASALEELQSELTCPVCLELFRDPVILECGHHFCKVCITQCWEANEVSNCPKCRKSCERKLRPNSLLCNVVESVRKARTADAVPAGIIGWDVESALEELEEREPGSSMSSMASSIGHWPRMGLDMCEEHEEKLKLYCEDDQLPICLVCGMSRDHKNHNVIPINEAFENYKVRQPFLADRLLYIFVGENLSVLFSFPKSSPTELAAPTQPLGHGWYFYRTRHLPVFGYFVFRNFLRTP